MKTNHTARQIVRVRMLLAVLSIFAIVAFEVGLGATMAARLGHTTGVQTEIPPTPNVSLGDLVSTTI